MDSFLSSLPLLKNWLYPEKANEPLEPVSVEKTSDLQPDIVSIIQIPTQREQVRKKLLSIDEIEKLDSQKEKNRAYLEIGLSPDITESDLDYIMKKMTKATILIKKIVQRMIRENLLDKAHAELQKRVANKQINEATKNRLYEDLQWAALRQVKPHLITAAIDARTDVEREEEYRTVIFCLLNENKKEEAQILQVKLKDIRKSKEGPEVTEKAKDKKKENDDLKKLEARFKTPCDNIRKLDLDKKANEMWRFNQKISQEDLPKLKLFEKQLLECEDAVEESLQNAYGHNGGILLVTTSLYPFGFQDLTSSQMEYLQVCLEQNRLPEKISISYVDELSYKKFCYVFSIYCSVITIRWMRNLLKQFTTDF